MGYSQGSLGDLSLRRRVMGLRACRQVGVRGEVVRGGSASPSKLANERLITDVFVTYKVVLLNHGLKFVPGSLFHVIMS